MKNKIIEIIKTNAFLLRVVAFLYNLRYFNLTFNHLGKNRIITKGIFLRGTQFKIEGKGNEINIHPENRLFGCFIFIKGNNCKIDIGRHCILTNTEIWIEDDFGSITIGNLTTIEGAHIAATEGKSIIIGEDCMFSSGIQIRNGDSHAVYDQTSKQRINEARSVQIGNHVWLGADVKVLKGSVIGDGAVIATSAIITGNVDQNSIYAGSPAKKIKDAVIWKRSR